MIVDRVCTRPFTPGRCHTCGGPIEGKGRFWYCSKQCKVIYWVNHYWEDARKECLRRAGGGCVKCGNPGKEAHHIVPLNGLLRHDNCLNHQDNLTALCHQCHKLTLAHALRMMCLSNGRVAWEIGNLTPGAKGRLARWYRDAIYLPPDGWYVMAITPSVAVLWEKGELGELRMKNL